LGTRTSDDILVDAIAKSIGSKYAGMRSEELISQSGKSTAEQKAVSLLDGGDFAGKSTLVPTASPAWTTVFPAWTFTNTFGVTLSESIQPGSAGCIPSSFSSGTPNYPMVSTTTGCPIAQSVSGYPTVYLVEAVSTSGSVYSEYDYNGGLIAPPLRSGSFMSLQPSDSTEPIEVSLTSTKTVPKGTECRVVVDTTRHRGYLDDWAINTFSEGHYDVLVPSPQRLCIETSTSGTVPFISFLSSDEDENLVLKISVTFYDNTGGEVCSVESDSLFVEFCEWSRLAFDFSSPDADYSSLKITISAEGSSSNMYALAIQSLFLYSIPTFSSALTIESTSPLEPVEVPEAVLPGWDSYFGGNDTSGLPSPPTAGISGAGIEYVNLSWVLPPEALWRTWEIYRDTTAGFTPGLGNLIDTIDATVYSDKRTPGSGPWYYKVCAVNSRGEKSTFTSFGPFTLAQVATGDIVDGAINSIKIATGALTSGHFGVGAVNLSSSIVTGSLEAYMISAGALNAGVIYGGTIGTDQLVASGATITNAMIAQGTITSAVIGYGAIDTANIANAAITSATIASGAITNAKIANLDAGKITTGTLSGRTISGGYIYGTTISGNTIYGGSMYSTTISGSTITGGLFRTGQAGPRIEIQGGNLNDGTYAVTSFDSGVAGYLPGKIITGDYVAQSGHPFVEFRGPTVYGADPTIFSAVSWNVSGVGMEANAQYGLSTNMSVTNNGTINMQIGSSDVATITSSGGYYYGAATYVGNLQANRLSISAGAEANGLKIKNSTNVWSTLFVDANSNLYFRRGSDNILFKLTDSASTNHRS
jgi:hypothetical protein